MIVCFSVDFNIQSDVKSERSVSSLRSQNLEQKKKKKTLLMFLVTCQQQQEECGLCAGAKRALTQRSPLAGDFLSQYPDLSAVVPRLLQDTE